jgi:hypothetical protein
MNTKQKIGYIALFTSAVISNFLPVGLSLALWGIGIGILIGDTLDAWEKLSSKPPRIDI